MSKLEEWYLILGILWFVIRCALSKKWFNTTTEFILGMAGEVGHAILWPFSVVAYGLGILESRFK